MWGLTGLSPVSSFRRTRLTSSRYHIKTEWTVTDLTSRPSQTGEPYCLLRRPQCFEPSSGTKSRPLASERENEVNTNDYNDSQARTVPRQIYKWYTDGPCELHVGEICGAVARSRRYCKDLSRRNERALSTPRRAHDAGLTDAALASLVRRALTSYSRRGGDPRRVRVSRNV